MLNQQKSPEESLFIERLELALKASNEGIWDWDLQRGKLYYSERILDFLKLDSGQDHNPFENAAQEVHPEDLEEFQDALAHFLKLEHETPLAVEARLRRQDGTWCWMRIRGIAVRDSKSRPIRVAGSMIDITKRKTIEDALEEERHLFRLLIENIPENVYFKDLGSNFVVANSATARKLGRHKGEEIVGSCDEDYFDEAHAAHSREDEVRIMETGKPIISSLERETWDDKEDTWVVTTKLPWHDRKGRLKGTFGITADVTKLVSTREKLRKTAAALKKRNRLYEEEIQLAREIQNALVPERFDPVSGPAYQLRTEHLYLPSSELGGDHLEVYAVDTKRAALVICDVMGHGVRSALVASMLRGLIEDQRRHLANPAHFLGITNDTFHSILSRAGLTLFATMSVVLVDLELGRMTYASAGHHPPVLVPPSGPVQALESSRNPALGLIPEHEFRQCEHPLPAGHRLFLYTDGLTEAANPDGEEWGSPALEACLQDLADRQVPEQDWSTAVFEKLSAHRAKASFEDDVCFILATLDSLPKPSSNHHIVI